MKIKGLSILPRSLDGIIAVLGVVVSLGLIGYLSIHGGNAVYSIIGILVLFFCLLWLRIKNRVSLPSDSKKHHTSVLLINIVFYSLLIIMIVTYYFRPHLYERPLIYFLLFSAMAGCISLEIYLYSQNNRHLIGIMSKIIFLSLISVWSEAALFPSILGVDPWAHQKLAQIIVQTGYMPEGYSYSKLPMMHLDVGSTMMLTGLNYKVASMLSIGLLQIICGILSGFLIGRFLFNQKVGLLAALIIPLGNQFIN